MMAVQGCRPPRTFLEENQLIDEETRTQTIIPASPGWYLALLVGGEFDHISIIAWEVARGEGPYRSYANRHPSETWVSHDVTPLTLYHNGLTNLFAVKRPDGKYEGAEGQVWDDEASALADLNKATE
jgi:hypothetical protein